MKSAIKIEDVFAGILALFLTAIMAIPYFSIVLILWILQMMKDFVLTGRIR